MKVPYVEIRSVSFSGSRATIAVKTCRQIRRRSLWNSRRVSQRIHADTGSGSWFDFAVGGDARKDSEGALVVLSALSYLGCGNITRKPRENHFPGSLNESYTVFCSKRDVFVKINKEVDAASMFEGEAASLRHIAATNTVRCPEPLLTGDLPDGGSYLVMESLDLRPFGMLQDAAQDQLGRAMAGLHAAPVLVDGYEARTYGLSTTTKLGVMPLDNTPNENWADFFLERRLQGRLHQARQRLQAQECAVPWDDEKVLASASRTLEGFNPKPSMLHGDLWIGNTGMTRDGQAAVYDPAGFVGDAEFDLAFAGWKAYPGFPGLLDSFYRAYHEVIPKTDGFQERRRLYQFFHLLNHVAIYGQEYVAYAEEISKEL